METYRIHEQPLASRALGQQGKQQQTEPAFDARVNRLRSLTCVISDQNKRLDAAIMRLSGLSPPGNSGSDDKANAPSSVLSKFDLILDHLEYLCGQNHDHLTRLESL